MATRTIAPARLKALRQTAGITQVQLSKLCRVEGGKRQIHTVTLCNYETGKFVECYELTAHILATGLSKALRRNVKRRHDRRRAAQPHPCSCPTR